MKRIEQAGFTLTVLAVVLTIVAVLISSLMYTLFAPSEARGRDETLRRRDTLAIAGNGEEPSTFGTRIDSPAVAKDAPGLSCCSSFGLAWKRSAIPSSADA